MPAYTVQLEVDVPATGSPGVSVRAVQPAAGGAMPSLDQLLSLYTEVGEHERHYSNVRMAATSLLFTIAVAAIAGFLPRIFASDGLREWAYYVSLPVFFLVASIAVNWHYARISAGARALERHIENLMSLAAQGIIYPLIRPDALFLRIFERLQRGATKAPLAAPAAPASTQDHIRHFEDSITGGHRVRSTVLDTPFWLVAGVSAALLGLLVLFALRPLPGPAAPGPDPALQRIVERLDAAASQRMDRIEAELVRLQAAPPAPPPLVVLEAGSQASLDSIAASLRSLSVALASLPPPQPVVTRAPPPPPRRNPSRPGAR
jgi:hypothetical protein